ncbi:hypothetical protein B296_00026794 [Ensete ventricosum]|uniref:Uncharacterized protein n=1 Tax=Ensete ventricosum TaxID=4639 RepID=A0A426ZHH2_ENSVE|nr:hypothetical protein B296_00026794 [Ensete ventricosum]
MWLGTRLKWIESSPRALEICQDSAREFAGRRSRLAGRLSGVAEMLVKSWKGLEFTEGIGKLVGNTLRDHQRKTVRLATRVPEAAGLTGVQDGIEKVKGITFSSFSTITGGTPKILGNMWQLYCPSRRLYRSYPDFRGAFGDCIVGTGGCTTHIQIF